MRYLLFGLLIVVGSLVIASTDGRTPPKLDSWVFVATLAKGEKQGIYLFRTNAKTGVLEAKGIAADAEEPSFLAIHPNGKVLYAVTSKKLAKDYAGAVEAFTIDNATGKLTLLNRQPSGGAEPVHVVVHPDGKYLAVANYSGASVALFPISGDGRIGEPTAVVKHTGSSVDPKRQKQPYPHGLAFDPPGKRLLVADLGLDKVIVYDVDTGKGTLTQTAVAALKPGSGPRHLAFSEDGNSLYVISEMSNTVTLFQYGLDGRLHELQTMSPWPDAVRDKDYGAEIATGPHGMYASDRGQDSVAILERDGAKLTTVSQFACGGKWPRHFGIDPTGTLLIAANQKSNSVAAFKLGAKVREAGKADVPAPVCVVFVPVQ